MTPGSKQFDAVCSKDLCAEVAKAHGIDIEELTSGSRRKAIAKARADDVAVI